MPNELAVQPPVAIVTPHVSFAPDVPPKPHRDSLNGHMDVCLAQSAIPHRAQLANILRVIGDTPTGLTLLDQFHRRFEKNDLPIVVNVLEAGAAPPPSVVAQQLWLPENLLAAHAQEIGVPPDVQHAPAVFDELAAALNAWRAMETLDQGKQDCIEMGKRFRAELSEDKNPFTPRRRADSAESVVHDGVRTRAETVIERAAATTTTVQQSGACDATTEDVQAADNAQAKKQGKKPGAFRRMKTMRRQLAHQITQPFNALVGLFERRRAERGLSDRSDKIPKATVYRSDAGRPGDSTHSMISSTSSFASSTPSNVAPARPGVDDGLYAAAAPRIATDPGTSAGEAGTPSTSETIVQA